MKYKEIVKLLYENYEIIYEEYDKGEWFKKYVELTKSLAKLKYCY